MGGGGGKEGGDEIHMRKELILGGKSCIFKGERGEVRGISLKVMLGIPFEIGKDTQTSLKNPIITKVGKGVISFEKTFDIFITLAC